MPSNESCHSHHNVPCHIVNTNCNANKSAPGISYFTPLQHPPAGTALNPQPNGQPIPKLFRPLKIRGLTLQNRIAVSPMCQYSADDGHATHWHLTHLGGILQRGPGLTIVEATAVVPEGRITPQDMGLWKDSQIEPYRQIVEFAHSQNQLIAIQLAHAGRKASTIAPWLSGSATAVKELGGWPDNVKGPSAVSFDKDYPNPKELTLDEIQEFKIAYLAAVRRALKAGFDAIEIHSAHGYLLHSFLSPHSNRRTDQYGGSFENRVRLALELVSLVRQEIPDSMPLFFRISATDWLEETEFKDQSWRLEDTVRLAPLLAEKGVDLLDVSSGGLSPRQHIHVRPAYQAPFAQAVKKAVGDRLLVGTVGNITEGKQANDLLEGDSNLDLALAGRPFQKNPGLVWAWADDLDTEITHAHQIGWGFKGRAKKQNE